MYGIRHEFGLLRRHFGDFFKWWFFHRNSVLSRKEFALAGKSYPYFVHHYNSTWDNERAIEIPVAAGLLQSAAGTHVLEVGNVLSHYMPAHHHIVDKYEHNLRGRVANCDILDYEPGRLFDLIVSISTMEHVGWDEEPRDPTKLLLFADKINALLNRGGQALITIPAGYNIFLDEQLRSGRLQFSEVFGMVHTSEKNEWRPADLNTVLECKYNAPYPCANGVVFGIWRKQ